MNVFLCVLTACMLGMTSAEWLNDFDKHLHFTCPSGQAVKKVRSIHANGLEDRKFDIECAVFNVDTAGQQESCSWTANYVNTFDEPVFFECAKNNFLAGMESVHSSLREDRRWKFYCCSYPKIHLCDCDLSGWTNDYDGYQNYLVPTGKVIKGVFSVHSNRPEDRLFQYEVCTVQVLDKRSGG